MMKIHIETISALPIAYMRRTGAYGEQNFKVMQNMKDWIRRHNLWDENGTLYSIAQDNPATILPENCRYDACFVTEQRFEEAGILHGTIPPGSYLVCEVLHTADDVQRFWGSIGGALAQAKKKLDEGRPILERYQISLVERGYCEFCIPILP